MAHPVGSTGDRRFLGFFPGLEGLRGVAVLVILIFHADERWLPGGFLGVSTFFTLSGFLITRLLVAEVQSIGRVDLTAFYVRRVRRILPASLVALLGVALFGFFAADVTQLMRLRSDGLSALFYMANWWLIASGSEYATQLGSPSPIQHFWSLAIEEQFYLFFPWIVMLAMAGRRTARAPLALLLAGLIVASAAWTGWLEANGASSSRLYYGTDTRCGELFAGSLLALFWNGLAELGPGWRRNSVAALGVVGVGVSAIFWATAHPFDVFLYRGGLSLYALASVAILAAALLPVGPVRQLLAWQPLRWLGRISYGAYLYHWPIFLWLDADRSGLDPLALSFLRVALTLALSELSYRLLEQPIRSGSWWQGRRLSIGVVGSAVVVSLCLVFATRNVDDPWMLPKRAQSVPVASVPSTTTRIAVFGDSVAAGLGAALERWARSQPNIHVETFAAEGCGIARGGHLGAVDTRRCDDWELRFTRVLDRARPDIAVMLSAGWDVRDRRLPGWEKTLTIGDEIFDRWLRSELNAATDFMMPYTGRLVYLTSPCIRFGRGLKEGHFIPERTVLYNETILERLASERPDEVSVVDLFSKVCRDGEVVDSFEGMQNVRPDGIHFSEEAADWIASWLGPQLAEIANREKSEEVAPSPPARAAASVRTRRVRVTMLGDSVAVGLGDALRRWGSSRKKLILQTLAVEGCGIARVPGDGSAELRDCGNWRKRLPDQLRKFDPDVIVVVTAGWDLEKRKLKNWEAPLGMEDPRFVSWVRSEYEHATRMLGARSAQIVYLTSPCVRPASVGFEASTIRQFNDDVIRPLGLDRPAQVSVLDLFERVCDNGELLDSVAGIQNARPDGVHFSTRAYAWIAGWLGPEISALVEARAGAARPPGARSRP